MELAVRSTNAWEREPPVVATFGEAMVRLSTPARERIATAPALALHVAGAEVNVAVDLALLGVPAAWIGTLPRDPLGRRAAAELRAAGVMLDHVAWADRGRMGLFFVEQGAGSRPTAVHYDRAGSAFATGARWPAGALAGVRWVVVSGITLAVSDAARRAVAALAADAATHGTRICVDVNHRSRLWDAPAARAALEPLLAAADVVICSASDARTVFSCAPDPRALRDLVAPRASLVVVTRGAEGAVALAGEELHEVAALPTVVVDRLGIGDAFAAGLLSGLADELGPPAALARGAALAALKATIAGDHAFVSRGELDAAVARLLASASGPLRAGRASEVAPSAAGPGQADLGSEVAR